MQGPGSRGVLARESDESLIGLIAAGDELEAVVVLLGDLEAWALEVDGDLPAGVQDLRHGNAAHVG